MSEAAIKNAALEAGIVIHRADGDFISDSPVNLSRFIRFLARQPYVLPVDKSADRIEELEADFNSAAAAASEYSEFWEQHHGDFDQFGNYVPYSQMDGDLRAAKARIEALEEALRDVIILTESQKFGSARDIIEVARAALAPEQDKT